MTTVWIVQDFGDHGYGRVCGVFTDKVQAEAFRDELDPRKTRDVDLTQATLTTPEPAITFRQDLTEAEVRDLADKFRASQHTGNVIILPNDITNERIAEAVTAERKRLTDGIRRLLTSGPIGRQSGERYIRADLIRAVLDDSEAT